jgi:hypothetical protein
MLVVAYKSVVPLPEPPAGYALFLFAGYTVVGGAVLAYFKLRGTRSGSREPARRCTRRMQETDDVD